MNKLFFFLALLLGFNLSAQVENMGAKSHSMGGVSVCSEDFWAIKNNPAGLGDYRAYAFGISYESRYRVDALGLKQLGLIMPLGKGAMGLAVQSFGYSLFSRNEYGLAYGLALSPDLKLGIKLNYNQIILGDNYGKSGSLSGDFGFVSKPFENFIIGAHVHNISRAIIEKKNGFRYPTVLRLGGAYLLGDKGLIALECEKDLKQSLNVKAGVEYRPVKPIFIRFGFASNPFLYSFGFGFQWREQFFMDIGASVHQVLGYSPAVSLCYKIAKSKKQ